MDFFRQIFPEDPDENEVNRTMLMGLLVMITVAGSIYLLSPAPRIRAWWNRTALPTPTPVPATAPAEPTVAENRAINQNLPGAFVEQDGDDQDMSPDDFTKSFWQYTEQDVANMKAAWNKCLAGRAADSTAYTERISQLQTEAANTRQTERIRVAVEARRADAAEIRADTAEARAASAENELLQHKRRFETSKLFRHHADDEKMINQLREDKKDLQRELDACVNSRRRSFLPKEVEELQMQLEHAQQETSDVKKNLVAERKRNINISLRGVMAEKLIAEHGRSSNIRCRLNQARATVSEQKSTIEQQRLDLEEHSANAATQQGRLDACADALEQYKTANSEQKRTIERQQEELEQYQTKLQKSQAKGSRLVAANQQLQEKYNLLFEEFQRKETFLEESEKTLDEARQTQSKSESTEAKLRVDINELNSEADRKESNLANCREEIKTLKEHLATSQADLFEGRAPAGPLKPDNKIKQIIGLKQQVAGLQSQLEIEVGTGRKALAASQADLATAVKELEALRNAKSSGTEGSPDAAAQKQIRMLTARLDASKVALGKSRAAAEEQTTKTGELIAQIDQLQRENAGAGSKDSAKITTLQQERDAAKSETARIRLQAAQEIQQAKDETEQLRTDTTEKIQQAELQIQTLKNTETNSSNQNGEIQRLQTTNNDLAAKVKDLHHKLKEAHGGWDHWGAVATNLETQRVSLEKSLEIERNELKAANAAGVAKDNQIQQLKSQLENAKAVETAALADLHGEGKAVIDNLQQQLDREKKAHETVLNAQSSLRMRAYEIEQERNALKQTVLADTTNSPAAIENTTLRQQVADLQRRLTDNNSHFNRQIFDLTAAVDAKDQTIAGLNSKYKGHTPVRSNIPTVPQHTYDNVSRENTQLREENLRLKDFQSKLQGPNAPKLSAQLQDEQTRRVKAEDRYNKLFPQIEGLRKQLRDCEDIIADKTQAPASSTESANLTQVIQLNNTLRATIVRNNERSARQLADLGRDRDQLLQRVSDIQRQGGDSELADLLSTVRQLTAKNAELQAWRDKHEFMVQQADMMADAERKIAAARGDIEKAKRESAAAGFGTRGTVRKEYESEGVSPPGKGSKQPRVEVEVVDDEELFGPDETS